MELKSCDYHVMSGDLALEEGEWVTLLEAPLGGQWWRGQASAGEGWFPKSHVKFVDREAERRKAEEGELGIFVLRLSNGFALPRQLQTGSCSYQGC